MEANIELLKKDAETAEMLCKIANGFWDRTVELIHSPGDRVLVCRVGDLWFHFLNNRKDWHRKWNVAVRFYDRSKCTPTKKYLSLCERLQTEQKKLNDYV